MSVINAAAVFILAAVVGCQSNEQTAKMKLQPLTDAIVSNGFHPVIPPRGGIEPGSIWEIDDFHAVANECPRPAFLPDSKANAISLPRSVTLSKGEFNTTAAGQVFGADIQAALGASGFSNITIDFGDADIMDVSLTEFARPESASKWDSFYRDKYDEARTGKSRLSLITSVVVTRGLNFIISGTNEQSARLAAQALKTDANASFSVQNLGTSEFKVATSGTRSVIFGYLYPRPENIPPLPPVPSPQIGVTTPLQSSKLEYVLLWSNHYEPNTLYQVNTTNPSQADIRNNEFKNWCSPFNLNGRKVVSQVEVAGDEHFKTSEGRPANWWTQSPYNLPALNERWFQIMDDERWYVMTIAKD